MGGSAKRQRTNQVVVRCTDEELAVLDRKADRAGMARAAFLRTAGLGEAGPRAQRRLPADHQQLRQILGHLGRVGSNVNQIARQLNSGEQVAIPEIRAALAAYLELRNAIFDALGLKTAAAGAGNTGSHGHQGKQP